MARLCCLSTERHARQTAFEACAATVFLRRDFEPVAERIDGAQRHAIFGSEAELLAQLVDVLLDRAVDTIRL